MTTEAIEDAKQDGGASPSLEDITMDDAAPTPSAEPEPNQEEVQSVKVEDLFADMNDDDIDDLSKDVTTPPSSGSDSPAAAPNSSYVMFYFLRRLATLTCRLGMP